MPTPLTRHRTVRKARPDRVPNLRIWFDSSDLSTVELVAGRVANWYDKSPSRLVAVTPTISSVYRTDMRPYYDATLGGLPALRFDGLYSNLDIVDGTAPIINSIELTYLLVFRSAATGRFLFTNYHNGDTTTRLNVSSSRITAGYFVDTVASTALDFTHTTNPRMLVGKVKLGASSFITCDVTNGSESLSGVLGATNTIAVTNIRIGARASSAITAFYGEIAEIMLFTRILDPSEIAGLQSYLIPKWSLAT